MDSLLHQAVQSNNLDQITRLLQTPGLDVDALGDDGCTPLCYTSEHNYLEAARLLIAAGADVKWNSFRWYSPLHLAATNGHTDMVTLLLDSGADIDCSESAFPNPLVCACDRGHREIIHLLIERGADVNKEIAPSGLRPLHCAVHHDNATDIIEALLAAGADVDGNGHTDRSNTPLHLAARAGKRNSVRALLAGKADPNLEKDSDDSTALVCAIYEFDAALEIIEDLLRYGANVLHKNKRTGRTALQCLDIYHGTYATTHINIRNKYCQIASILVAAGDRNWDCVPVPCHGIERALLPVWKEAPGELPEVYTRLEEDLKYTLHVCLRIVQGRLPVDLRMRVLGDVLEK